MLYLLACTTLYLLKTLRQKWENIYIYRLSNINPRASRVAQLVKHLSAVWETWVQFLGWEVSLEKEIATHSSILAWRIPWIEEPGRLQSTGLQRVGRDWANSLSLSIYMVKSNPENIVTWLSILLLNYICCSVAQSCLTLREPVDCSTPGFPVLHYLPELAQIHIYWVDDAIQPSHSLLLLPFCP